MIINNNWGQTLDILQRSLHANVTRQNVLANNIANTDTPNFKRSSVNFETGLRQALSQKPPVFQEKLTHERHIPFYQEMKYTDVTPKIVTDFASVGKNNGNNVDIDSEASRYTATLLSYQMLTRATDALFQNINIVLR